LFFTGLIQIGVDLIPRFSRVQEITDFYQFFLADPIGKSKQKREKKKEKSLILSRSDLRKTNEESRDRWLQIRSIQPERASWCSRPCPASAACARVGIAPPAPRRSGVFARAPSRGIARQPPGPCCARFVRLPSGPAQQRLALVRLCRLAIAAASLDLVAGLRSMVILFQPSL
jgi:hypothetical protein